MKISNILKYIILLILFSLSIYAKEKSDINKLRNLKVATIDLDNHFKINKPLRRETVRTINRYHYLKQKRTITVDRAKKKLFGTNQLNIEDGLTVASNLNIRIAILIDSEKVLITNDNITNKVDTNNQVTNNTFSNNFKDYQKSNNYKIINNAISNNIFINSISTDNILTNEIIENDTSLTNDSSITNETKDFVDLISKNIDNNKDANNTEEKYEFKYNFNVIDIETDNILREYKLVSSNESIYTIQRISDYLESYLAKMVFDSFEERKNNIELNFEIEKVSSGNQTNSILDEGDITEGDSISIKFNPNKDGYLYIFALQNNGNMVLMYPNDFNNFVNTDNIQKDEIEAGENYTIPPENSMFRIAVSPVSLGDENSDKENIDSFYAVYTKINQKWITGQYFSGNGFKMVSRNRNAEFVFKLKSKLKLKREWQIEKIYLNVVSKLKDR